jgi:hypothetical protein
MLQNSWKMTGLKAHGWDGTLAVSAAAYQDMLTGTNCSGAREVTVCQPCRVVFLSVSDTAKSIVGKHTRAYAVQM